MAHKIYADDEKKLKIYRNRVSSGTRALEVWEPRARQFIRRYRNDWTGDVFESEIFETYNISIPTGSATIDSLFASLTAVQVSIAVNNKAHGTVEQRRIAESAIDEVWRDQRVGQKSEYAVKDALLTGIGWVKVGYDFASELVEQDRKQEDIEADIDTIYTEAEAEGISPPDPMAVSEVVPLTEQVEKVLRDRVVVDYVPWDQVIWDPAARTSEDIRWICHVQRVPAHEVQTNEDFIEYVVSRGGKRKDVEELKPDSLLESKYRGNRIDEEDDNYITLHEMWDFVSGTVCTFAKNGDFILLEQVNPLARVFDDLEDMSPFIPLILRGDPEGVRGISDMELIEPLLNELNHYRSTLAAYLAQFVPKLVAAEGTLTESGKMALGSADPGDVVELETGKSPQDVDTLDPPTLPQEMYGIVERIVNDIREATGVSELMRGIFPDRKRTATETTEVVAASAARQSEKRNRIERFYTDIARRILFYIMLWYDDERVSRIADLDGDTIWEWRGDDIVMEADLVVTLQPREIKDAQTRKEDAQFLLGVLGPIQEVDRRELAAFVLDEMGYDRKETRRLLKLDEEIEDDRQKEMQTQADAALAAEGVAPESEVSMGEGIDPTVMAAAEAGGYGANAATEVLLTP